MELAGDAAILGSTYEIHRELGSTAVLDPEYHGLHVPGEYTLSDQEFRDFIAQKKVYTAFGNYFIIANGRNPHLGGCAAKKQIPISNAYLQLFDPDIAELDAVAVILKHDWPRFSRR
jgi:hypothetical protein